MPDRILAKMSPKTRISLGFGFIVVLCFVLVFGAYWIVDQNSNRIDEIDQGRIALAKETKERSKEVQASREASCERTYEGIRQVFEPFFPKPPLTEEEKYRITTFNDNIEFLKLGCKEQVDPDTVEKG